MQLSKFLSVAALAASSLVHASIWKGDVEYNVTEDDSHYPHHVHVLHKHVHKHHVGNGTTDEEGQDGHDAAHGHSDALHAQPTALHAQATAATGSIVKETSGLKRLPGMHAVAANVAVSSKTSTEAKRTEAQIMNTLKSLEHKLAGRRNASVEVNSTEARTGQAAPEDDTFVSSDLGQAPEPDPREVSIDMSQSQDPGVARVSVTMDATPVEDNSDFKPCPGNVDIDTSMPYGELEAFGREDTAQELTESSITESDEMVDQLERAEVAEEKRATFRALTRLRGAAITSFDGVARSQTGNIDEYNKVHKWRSTHPLRHLADEESDISKWAFPDNADFLQQWATFRAHKK
jgi:hypothetical protein